MDIKKDKNLQEAGSLSFFEELFQAIKYLKDNSNNDSSDKSVSSALMNAHYISSISSASLASRAKLNICQFPLLASSTIGIDTYRKTAEILEHLYAEYLRLVIVNQLEVIDLEKKQNKFTILSKVHQNDNALLSGYEATKEHDLRKAGTQFDLIQARTEMAYCTFSKDELVNANRELMKPYNENFNLKGINGKNYDILTEDSKSDIKKIKSDLGEEYTSRNAEYISVCSELRRLENEVRSIEHEISSLKEDIERGNFTSSEKANMEKEIKSLSIKRNNRLKKIDERLNYKKSLESILISIASKKGRILSGSDENTSDVLKQKDFENKQKSLDDLNKFRKKFGSVTDFNNTTIRKLNEIDPTILTFGLKYYSRQGDFADTNMSVGVKTITHLIDSNEMTFYIFETLKRRKKFFRPLQILTGEKEFSLKFLFHLDRAKRDAKMDSTAAKWWRHLKDRRTESWIKAFRGKDPYVPNATLLLSYEDYQWLILKYKIDLIKDLKSAYTLTDLLFLMHLVIVDDVNNEIYLFDKENRSWEQYTLDKLRNEINAMNKMSANIYGNKK